MIAPIAESEIKILEQEVARRRTFAIISHPDAGKTTLTEKLLLYAGAVNQAGSVRARKNQRAATSDWMAMEQQRGISITSTTLQFEYGGCAFNLLDTPGHRDFSEDTYRTLMAADSAVMVLDSAKGIESQTRKLFEVCRQRNLPILTFINKLDHVGRDPLELLDEIERLLDLRVSPLNWPIGSAEAFQGVFDLRSNQVLLFERSAHGQHRAPVQVSDLADPRVAETIGERAHGKLCEDVELLAGAGAPYDHESFLAGTLTPVFFGSALNNFGVQPFLDALVALAPAPRPRESDRGPISPTTPAFSGIVFKIQANMDPRHRDTMAFLRVCSGRFEKDMMVNHARLGRAVRMSRPHRLFARDRETVEVAYPGDVVGFSNPGVFRIGDTVSAGEPFAYAPIPSFHPECFAILRNVTIEKHKQFNKGLDQLREEGVTQVLYAVDQFRREPILCAVGELQFEVVVSRLATEYGAEAALERLPHSDARWLRGSAADIESMYMPLQCFRARDQDGRDVVLFASTASLKYAIEKNPKLEFLTLTELNEATTRAGTSS